MIKYQLIRIIRVLLGPRVVSPGVKRLLDYQAQPRPIR